MGLNDLGGPGGFLSRVEVLYRALVLDSRALVVGGAEAGLTDPRGSVEHFHRDLEHRLAANTKHLQRLRTCCLMLPASASNMAYIHGPAPCGASCARNFCSQI